MRRSGVLAGGVLALLVTVVAAVRVFAPADTLDRSHQPYPQPAAAYGTVYGELMHAPLFVGTRMRVYAADNRVWADGPVDDKMPTSALWAYRRWPAQLVGVVAGEHVVVSKWSDGRLVALAPDTGRVRWRARSDAGVTAYQGRRTGARTVYDPPDLYLTQTADGRPVVVSFGAAALTAFDADTGTRLWHRTVGGTPACRTDFTGPGIVAALDRCAGRSTVDVYDAATGAPRTAPPGLTAAARPVGCPVGRSGCTGLAAPGGGWLIGPDGGFTAAPELTGTGSWLIGRLVVHPSDDGHVVAHDAVTGAPAWSWPDDGDGSGARIVAVEPDRVHVVTPERELVTIDAATGRAMSAFPGHIIGEDKPWQPGYVHAAHGFLAIERLLPGARPGGPDGAYYYPFPTVLLTGS